MEESRWSLPEAGIGRQTEREGVTVVGWWVVGTKARKRSFSDHHGERIQRSRPGKFYISVHVDVYLSQEKSLEYLSIAYQGRLLHDLYEDTLERTVAVATQIFMCCFDYHCRPNSSSA